MTLDPPDSQARFLALLAQHQPILRKVAGSYGGNHQDRHDLIQEITLQLWKAWPGYDPARPFPTWMYRIALNVGISHLRSNRHAHRQPLSLDGLDIEPVDRDAADPDLDEQVALLQRFIIGLDPLNRALLLLYMDEHSHRDIADILGISESNVGTRISRLKQKARNELAGD